MSEDFNDYTDADGDGLRVQTTSISVRFYRTGFGAYAGLPRDEVRNLRDALNRWLDEQQRNDPDPAGLDTAPPYETLIRRAVAEEVARVLPLHQSPQAAVCNERGCQATHKYATNTGVALCVDPFCTLADGHAEHDPEPKAVGHPEAPGVEWPRRVSVDYCVPCGHSWSRHGVGAGNCNVRVQDAPGCFRDCGCEQVRGGAQ